MKQTKTVEVSGTEYSFEKEETEILGEDFFENDNAPAEAHLVLEDVEEATSGAAQLAREKLAERMSEKHGYQPEWRLGKAECFELNDGWEVAYETQVTAQGVEFPATVFKEV